MAGDATINAAAAPGIVPTILLVEDFDQLRQLSSRFLSSSGYRVLEARNGLEALACFDANPAGIDLLVTDLRMPQMNGVELIAQIRCQRPGLPVLMLSGYASEAISREALSLPDCLFLQKPCLPAELLTAVQTALSTTRAKSA